MPTIKKLRYENHPVSGEMDVKSGGKPYSTIEVAQHSTYISLAECIMLYHAVEFRGIRMQQSNIKTTAEFFWSDP